MTTFGKEQFVRRIAILTAVILIALAVLMAGCGGKSTETKNAPTAQPSAGASVADMSAGDILKKSTEAMGSFKSASGTMDMQMDVKVPSPEASASTVGSAAQSMAMKGGWAASEEPAQGEAMISFSAAGQTMDMGVKYIGEKAWIEYMGQWYVAPPKTMKQLKEQQKSQGGQTSPLAQLDSLKDMGIDPTTWASELTVVGSEEMDGASVYHVALKADTVKIITDLMKVMQDPKVTKMLGDSAAGMGSVQDLTEQDKKQIEEMFKSASADLWVDTSTFYLRKLTVKADIAAPSGESAGAGFESASIAMTVTFDEFDQPVTVEPPANAKPWKELQQAGSGLGGLSI